MVALVQGFTRPFTQRGSPQYDAYRHLLATVVKTGIAVGAYFLCAAMIPPAQAPLLLTIAIVYRGLKSVVGQASADAGVGTWLIVDVIRRIAQTSLWGLGLGTALELTAGIVMLQSPIYNKDEAFLSIDNILGIKPNGKRAKASI